MVQRNQLLEHYPEFKELLEHLPGRSFAFFDRYGSQSFNNSHYLQTTRVVMLQVVNGWIAKYLVAPSLLILGSTVLLHRNRAFVLSTTGGFRSFLLKYVPLLTIFGTHGLKGQAMIPVDCVDQDFAEIQE